MFIDVKKAHTIPKCEEDVYIELPEECGAKPGFCGKLKFWLYGFRKAASAWEAYYSELLEGWDLREEYRVAWCFIIP